MDANRFDHLSRLFTAGSRRRILVTLSGAALGGFVPLLGVAEAEARNARRKCQKIKEKQRRQKCLKKAKQHNRQHAPQSSAAPPPPPPSSPTPTCSDGIKNSTETDIDCGGFTCPRCASGKTCTSRDDCASALCVGGTCQPCGGGDCGTDMHGGCVCDGGTCTKGSGFGVSSCEACPANTICRGVKGGFACFWICGTA